MTMFGIGEGEEAVGDEPEQDQEKHEEDIGVRSAGAAGQLGCLFHAAPPLAPERPVAAVIMASRSKSQRAKLPVVRRGYGEDAVRKADEFLDLGRDEQKRRFRSQRGC